jgi:hypothetical protein
MAKTQKNTEQIEDNVATTATPEVKIVKRTVTESPELIEARLQAEAANKRVEDAKAASKAAVDEANRIAKEASDTAKKSRADAKAKKLEAKRLAKEEREANRAAKPVKTLEKSCEMIYTDSRAGFECQMFSSEELIAKCSKLLDCFGEEMNAQHLYVEYQLSGSVKTTDGNDYPLRGSYNPATPLDGNKWHLTYKNVDVIPANGSTFEHAKVCVMNPNFSRQWWTGRV